MSLCERAARAQKYALAGKNTDPAFRRGLFTGVSGPGAKDLRAPLTRAQFDAWRRAFDNLLACAASEASRDECILGWFRDVGDMVPESEQAFARSLLEYYMDQHLRADPAPAVGFCAE